MISGDVYALLAGFLGAVASSSAKLSLGADHLRDMCDAVWMDRWGDPGDPWSRSRRSRDPPPGEETETPCDWLHIPLRLLCGGLLFTCNAVMWTFFSKALRHCSSSARATVTTTASNFVSSAVLGRLVFGETHMALWWVGISLTLSGLLVLHHSSPQTTSPISPPHREGDEAKKDD